MPRSEVRITGDTRGPAGRRSPPAARAAASSPMKVAARNSRLAKRARPSCTNMDGAETLHRSQEQRDQCEGEDSDGLRSTPRPPIIAASDEARHEDDEQHDPQPTLERVGRADHVPAISGSWERDPADRSRPTIRAEAVRSRCRRAQRHAWQHAEEQDDRHQDARWPPTRGRAHPPGGGSAARAAPRKSAWRPAGRRRRS